MPQSWPDHLFLVGCGNMAGAMLSRWLDCGMDPDHVTVMRPSGRPVAEGVRVLTTFPSVLPTGAVVLLGLKPQQLEGIAADLSRALDRDSLLISILAGTTIPQLRDLFPMVPDIVRVMPNTPVRTGQGVCAIHADATTGQSALSVVCDLMAPLGLVEPIADEAQFNLVTALSGCGPAYLFRFIDALAAAGAAWGLDETQAQRLALATVEGAVTLATTSGENPGILADRVASPGGMTRSGMDVLDRPDGLTALLVETIRTARDRGEEMAAIR